MEIEGKFDISYFVHLFPNLNSVFYFQVRFIVLLFCGYFKNSYICRESLLCQTMELKDIMKQRRDTLLLTQQDLAEMSQVGLATIKDIERGKGNPALSTVKKILDVLGIEIEYRIRQTV